MASKKAQSPAMDFIVSALKANRSAAYADIKAKADAKKLAVYPIMFGRAQALLGIVKSAKRGQGKAARAKAASKPAAAAAKRGRQIDPSSKSGRIRALLGSGMSAAEIAKKVGATPALVYNVKASMSKGGAVKRGPGRPPKVATSSSFNGLDGILDAVRNAERDRARMRAALEKLQSVVAGALA